MLRRLAALVIALPFAVTAAHAQVGVPGGGLAQRIGHYMPGKMNHAVAVHAGAGDMNYGALLGSRALSTPVNFMHRGVVNPHSSIGQHFHNDCEETFVILDGADAQFTINGRTAVVPTPAVVPDRRGSSHAVYNASDKPIQWLNFNVGMRKGSSDSYDLADNRVGAPLDPIPQFINVHMDASLLKPVEKMNGGAGTVMYRRLLEPTVFFSTWSYIDEVSIPVGASIGAVTDPNMSEAYYVISGAGTVTVNGETVAIKEGDAIPVDLGETHAFAQTGSQPLHMLEYGIAKDYAAKEALINAPGPGLVSGMHDFLLPEDWREGTFLGRLDFGQGPTPVLIRNGQVFDVSRRWPTAAALLNVGAKAGWAGGGSPGEDLGPAQDLIFKPVWVGASTPRLLAPIDLQCVKAAGVTFAASTLERMIEERAGGDIAKADSIREKLTQSVGSNILSVVPGSAEAARLKGALIADGLWSQYLEVAIGPDAEIFTKAPLLSSVGWGDYIGVRSDSRWNNSEPEIVLVCDRDGAAVGAALGNDVNLRDFEGRSALLLGKAKDNNASCSIGPFIRLFDESFTIDTVRKADVKLEIVGTDNYVLNGTSSMARISRDPLELARQAMSEHQYPDGFVLFMGTMFAPTQDRDTPGHGFSHKEGDIVRISSPQLGVLENRITSSKAAPPWIFGISDLMTNLARRGLL